ncbi:MAG: hypothetical protein J0M29_10755 [Chitinophagales bacterium]|nr:hypothetical protein [Chitinophagales bacterium]
MKKVLCTIAFAGCALLAKAQLYVEGVKLEPSNTGQYLEIDPLYREDGRCAFQVDYGQSNPKEDYVTDPYGKRFDFRSLVDGLNFFYEEGWQVDQVSVLDRGRRYLLKRRY